MRLPPASTADVVLAADPPPTKIRLPNPLPALTLPVDLNYYDKIVVAISGGKDSAAMLWSLVAECRRQDVPLANIVAVHADLGIVEWNGVRELAEDHARACGVEFATVSRHGRVAPKTSKCYQKGETWGGLLDHVRRNGYWPKGFGAGGRNTRFCTSDHKRDPIKSIISREVDRILEEHRALIQGWRELRASIQDLQDALVAAPEYDPGNAVAEATDLLQRIQARLTQLDYDCRGAGLKKPRPARILNAIGMRAGESPDRERMEPLKRVVDNRRRVVDEVLPVHTWSEQDVWRCHWQLGIPVHPAYGMGMPRLSCSLCILANRLALLYACILRPQLAAQYAEVEQAINHKFQAKTSIQELLREVRGASPLDLARTLGPASMRAWEG